MLHQRLVEERWKGLFRAERLGAVRPGPDVLLTANGGYSVSLNPPRCLHESIRRR